MARFSAVFVALFAVMLSASAAPVLETRASEACSISRGAIVASLIASQGAMALLANSAKSDAATAAVVSTAQKGVTSADEAVGVIANAIIQGAAPPAAARTQALAGLNAATAALANVTSTDDAVTKQVEVTKGLLTAATLSGNEVIKNC